MPQERLFCVPSDGKHGLGTPPRHSAGVGRADPHPTRISLGITHPRGLWPGEKAAGVSRITSVAPFTSADDQPTVSLPRAPTRGRGCWGEAGALWAPSSPRTAEPTSTSPPSTSHGGPDPGSLQTHLGEGQDHEGPPATGLHDDGQELGVDSTEGAVPRHLGDADVLVHLVGLHRLPEDVPELALAHHAAAHGWGGTGSGRDPSPAQHGGVLAPSGFRETPIPHAGHRG